METTAVHADVQLSPSEFALATWEGARTRRWPIAVGAFCVLLAFLGMAFVPDALLSFVALGLLGILLASGVLLTVGVWFSVVRDPSLREPVHLDAGPSGARFVTAHATSDVEWRYFRRARRTRHFLLLDSGVSPVMLPLRAFTPEQRSMLTSWLAPLLARP
jgi:hypothetical protein